MAEPIVLSSSDRFALVGKTGSGKTFASTLLATMLLPWPGYPRPRGQSKNPWQIWFVDTKGDAKDARRLGEWGFRTVTRVPDDWPRVIYKIRPLDKSDELSVAKQVQQLCWTATQRGNVLVVIDEYTSCVLSSRSVGAGLKNIYARGRGLHVGSIGCTQEPVSIPRQLASQATHLFLFNVTYTYDIDWCNTLCPRYGDGPPDVHGFWYRWLDGPKNVSTWKYYGDITELVTSTRQQRKAS